MFLNKPLVAGNAVLQCAVSGGMIFLATAKAYQFTAFLGKVVASGFVGIVVVIVCCVGFLVSLLLFLLFLVSGIPLVRGECIQGLG